MDEETIAVIIDKWYFEWKNKIVDIGIPHKLGFAKENLKCRIALAYMNEEKVE